MITHLGNRAGAPELAVRHRRKLLGRPSGVTELLAPFRSFATLHRVSGK